MGCTFLDSAQMAYDYLDRAIQSDPKLRRAYFYRGLAAERVGRDAKATLFTDEQRKGAVHRPRIQMEVPQRLRYAFGRRALSGADRAVDGNNDPVRSHEATQTTVRREVVQLLNCVLTIVSSPG